MKHILAIISILFISVGFAQNQSIKQYTLAELKTAHVDSVFAIDLQKMKLQQLPPIVFKFKNVTSLNVGKNKLKNLNGIEQLEHLTYLNAEKNILEYFPNEICQLKQLETLILNRNIYIDAVPACIENCQQLKTLDLWYTAVDHLPIEMTTIKTLKLIDFSGVQINQEGQNKLKKMFPNTKLVLSAPCNCMN